jgi:hypothetical protein
MITKDASIEDRIWFHNYANLGISVYGRLNCSFNSVTIPMQVVGTYTVSGSGTFATHYLYIDPATINGSFDYFSCQ